MSGARRSGGSSQAHDTDAAPTQPKTGGWHPIEWLCELAGTFFFLFLGFTTIAALESPLSPLNEALPSVVLRLVLIGAVFGILAAIVALSPVGRRSGAHLNPAVTIGFWAHGQTHTHDPLGFVAAQCLGAVLAAAFFATSGSWAETANFARTEPRPELSGWAAAGIEVAITFGLVLAVLLMVSSPRTVRWTPVGVTVALMVLIPLGGPLTGAGMNPARTSGPDVVSAQYPSLWVYLVGPALGALLGAGAFSLMASGRRAVLTAKLFHDERHPSVHASRMPTGRR